jgi:hypothetical protein
MIGPGPANFSKPSVPMMTGLAKLHVNLLAAG